MNGKIEQEMQLRKPPVFLFVCKWVLRQLLIGANGLFGIALVSLPASAEELVFSRDVLPILSANCFSCHGPDEEGRVTDLRLDERQSPLDLGIIVPGDPNGSELIRRVYSKDEYEVMPPVESHKKLSQEQKEVLSAWILNGAKYERHWAFVVPRSMEPPSVKREEWSRNDIDEFVLAELEDQDLEPSEEASRRTLIRRLSLGLTGLPPSAKEVSEFLADDRPEAYERLVDRLLSSPHFGEHMAQSWLDAARYADTNGYSIDGGRHMWLWRDWVIKAFNENKPYDEFLQEQLAGDLIPERSVEQLIATGFQRNNMVTHEGGTIPEENLVNYNADRVKTLGESILGLTIGCAQCHDHKFDPIKQRDYYQLFAFYNTASDVGLDGDAGVSPRPTVNTMTVLNTQDSHDLKQRIENLQSLLDNPSERKVSRWETRKQASLTRRGRDLAVLAVEPLSITTPNSGDGFDIEGDRVRISTGPPFAAYDILLKVPALDVPITGYRVMFQRESEDPIASLGFGNLEQSNSSTFVLTAVSLSKSETPAKQINVNRLERIERVTASSWLNDYRAENVLDMRRKDGWSPDSNNDKHPHVTLTLSEPQDSESNPYTTIQLNFGSGGALVAKEFRFYAITGKDDGTDLPEEMIKILQTKKLDRSPQQAAQLRQYYSAHAEETQLLRAELTNLKERLSLLEDSFPAMVMDVADTPRDTFVLNRGNYAEPGQKVTAGIPAALGQIPEDAPSNRLGLAEWIISPQNPLTARVAVNRLWQQLFGIGLVATPADFGTQGEWPSHPELLDRLAVEFQESGWDTKAMIRRIVLSATYRQSSATSEELLARDPQNRLLARGPRFRLSAEGVRDNALKVSGLLVDWIGGPSVNPYTPGDLWREVSHYGSTPATAQTFVQDHGSKLYRRSLYTYWKRTMPPPNMVAFDAPNREVCTVSRSTTTTPLQALVLLNDVQFVEATRAFAERIIKSASSDEDRISWAYCECIARCPSDEEAQIVESVLARERKRYASDKDAAEVYLSNGESPRDESIALSEHAAWAQVAALLLNLSEAVTQN